MNILILNIKKLFISKKIYLNQMNFILYSSFRIDYWLSSRLGPNFSWMTVQLDRNNDGKIIIQTGESGITANVMLCIYGDKDISKMIALRQTKNDLEAKFDQNSRLEFDLKEIDVGKVNDFFVIIL